MLPRVADYHARQLCEYILAVAGRTVEERYLPAGSGRLFLRQVGDGPPLVVLHGGPALDHEYLVPELDALANKYRVVYYAQRGRGASYAGEDAADVDLAGELDDLDLVRQHLGAQQLTLLGHSWGGLLAMEYAISRPKQVSKLVLLGTGPASQRGWDAVKRELDARRTPEQTAEMRRLAAEPRFLEGDLVAATAYDRIHFASTVADPADLEKLARRLYANFTPEAVRGSMAISDRLFSETWGREDYDLTPRLRGLHVPTLVITGDNDFIPLSVMQEIADALPDARLIVLPGCGHFPYLEALEPLVDLISDFAAG